MNAGELVLINFGRVAKVNAFRVFNIVNRVHAPIALNAKPHCFKCFGGQQEIKKLQIHQTSIEEALAETRFRLDSLHVMVAEN